MGHREWPPGPCGHAVGVRAGQIAQDSEGPAAGSEEEEETPPCLGDGDGVQSCSEKPALILHPEIPPRKGWDEDLCSQHFPDTCLCFRMLYSDDCPDVSTLSKYSSSFHRADPWSELLPWAGALPL